MSRTKAILSSYVGVLLYASLIFLAAGRLAYRPGIIYLVLVLVGTTLSHILEPKGSGLIVERAGRSREGEEWDKRILGAIFLVSILTFLLAGLDSGRFGWSPAFPFWLTVAAASVMMAGQLIFVLAKHQNAFFSSTTRIQEDRGHTVCDSGLYRLVRHPGYLGLLLSQLAFPVILNSLWAMIPAAVGVGLLLARTVKEDAFLQDNLAGYREYATVTRWRLLPFIL